MQITVKTDFPNVARQLARLQGDIAKKAMASALNKTVALAKTAMRKEILNEFNVKTADVNTSLVVKKAASGGSAFALRASLEARSGKGRSLNLIRFVERSVTMAQARKRMKAGEGGSYKLRGGGIVTKTLELRFKIKKKGAPVVIKGAFIANKGRTVFIREGKERIPIKALQTIDVAQMFNTKRINEKVVQVIEGRFGDIFANEAKFFTARFNASR